MRLEDIKAMLESDYLRYKQTLFVAVESNTEYLNKINEFILQKRGKELRPYLSLIAARICAEPTQLSYEVAAAAQLIHTATLMHDDVVDNAETRHGVPTVGAKFESGTAVLMGDFWLARALTLLNKHFNKDILGLFSLAVAKMSEGEIFQMQKTEEVDTTEADYYKIIEYKTSVLFMACMKSAAISVDAKQTQTEAINNYALHLGNAFQIKDDILDYTPSAHTGKPSGLDIIEKKLTLPLLCAFKNNPSKERQIRKLIKSGDAEKISSEVMEFVDSNGGLSSAQLQLKEEVDLAKSSLTVFSPSKEKDALIFLADYVGSREV